MMKTINVKRHRLLPMVILGCSLCFAAQAQVKGKEDVWAKNRSQYYQKELGLTEEQTGKMEELLFSSAKEKNKIRETTSGDEQQKAIWRFNEAHNPKIFAVLTPEQTEKMKMLWRGGGNKKNENVQQKNAALKAAPNQWARNRSQLYKKELGLTDEQSDKVYAELAAAAERAKEVRETTSGDAQKKALWRNGDERNKRLFELLTPEQTEKLKALWRAENNK